MAKSAKTTRTFAARKHGIVESLPGCRGLGLTRQEQQLFTFGFFLDNSPQEIMTPLAHHGWLGTGWMENTSIYISLLYFLVVFRIFATATASTWFRNDATDSEDARCI